MSSAGSDSCHRKSRLFFLSFFIRKNKLATYLYIAVKIEYNWRTDWLVIRIANAGINEARSSVVKGAVSVMNVTENVHRRFDALLDVF
jgi:hypothetical protein